MRKNRKTGRSAVLISLTIVLAMLLAACGGAATDGTGEENQATRAVITPGGSVADQSEPASQEEDTSAAIELPQPASEEIVPILLPSDAEIPSEAPTTSEVEQKKMVAGTYYAISCTDEDGNDLQLDGDLLQVYEDGTGIFAASGAECRFNWQYDGGAFTFVDEDGDTFNGNCYSGMIAGTYYYGYRYLFTSDEDLYRTMMENASAAAELTTAAGSAEDSRQFSTSNPGTVYSMYTLYERTYGIKTANALVPYGWNVGVSVEWGLLSTVYPACATIVLTSPAGDAKIEIRSDQAFLQMSSKGRAVPEGSYLDYYNVFLNYKDAHNYNDYVLGLLGYRGTILAADKPDWTEQNVLNQTAANYMQYLASGTGIQGTNNAGSAETTSYFITQGSAYEVEVMSMVIMAEIYYSARDIRQTMWKVPYTAVFTAYTEQAYSNYRDVFRNVVNNSSFCEEFVFVRACNSNYLTDMMHNYLMEQVYKPSSSEIKDWDSGYVSSGTDDFVNAWSDVIYERNEYTTESGDTIKVSTAYDTVYQNGSDIYMGPDGLAPEGWTKLNRN